MSGTVASATAMRGVAADEIAKFRSLQRHWWDPHGPLRSLHLFNPVRVRYIKDVVQQYGPHSFASETNPCNVLDVGCGGGILSESLARLGGVVTGIDMCAESVAVANQRQHERIACSATAAACPWLSRLTYQHVSLFDVVKKHRDFYDVVVASEVMEHVSDARGFLQALCEVVKPGGLLIVSTMDKSWRTALTHIVVAEHLTGVVPPGTHDWTKFIPPGDITVFADRFDVRQMDLQYVITYPDLWQSIATRNLQINFDLSSTCNTGHYFWTGLKTGRTSNQNVPPVREEAAACTGAIQ